MPAQDLKLLQERQIGLLTSLISVSTTKTTPTDNTSSTSTASSPSTSSSSTSTTTHPPTSTSTTPSSSISTSSISSPPVVITTVAGQTLSLTAHAGVPTMGAAPAAPTPFLQNKVLSGLVFGLAGFVGLILLIAVATFAIRRRRKKILLREAVMFDPVRVGYDDHLESGTMEKPRLSSSIGHAHESDAQSPAPFAEYAPRPYPTPYMYPSTAASQFRPPSAWLTPVQRHNT